MEHFRKAHLAVAVGLQLQEQDFFEISQNSWTGVLNKFKNQSFKIIGGNLESVI